MKKMLLFLLCLFFLGPLNGYALVDGYKDIVHDKVGVDISDDVVNIYLFYGNGCPHCAQEEKVLKQLENKYGDKIKIYRYETWKNSDNKNIMIDIKKELNITKYDAVPFTIIGEKTYLGYSEWVGSDIEKQIIYNLELYNVEDEELVVSSNKINIPLLGEIDVTKTAVGVSAVVLGFVDGFNPCAMWVLLFIINMLFGMKDRKKMFILGFAFLLTSAAFYFLSMLGINLILGFISTNTMRSLIGVVAIIFGIYNLYVYFKERKLDDGCHVVDEKKRKDIIAKVKKIKNAPNFIVALGCIILLAISVNMVELACSAGFPMIFDEIMVANEVTGVMRIVYLLIYVLFYMIDDMVVFTISICTLSIAGMTTKYNKLIKVVGGIIMLILGLLLILKPEWVMLNF